MFQKLSSLTLTLTLAVSLSLPIETERGDTVLFARQSDDVLSITRLVGGHPGQPGKYLETATGLRVTTRNWNTIERIVRLECQRLPL